MSGRINKTYKMLRRCNFCHIVSRTIPFKQVVRPTVRRYNVAAYMTRFFGNEEIPSNKIPARNNNKCKHCFLNKDLWHVSTGTTILHRSFATFPPHTKLFLPALSPTMETGTIVRWDIQEGDQFSVGDLLADIETDKATMGFEAADDGYMARILVQEGSKDVPVGAIVAIVVDDEDSVAAFKDYSNDGSDVGVGDSPSAAVSTLTASASPATSPSTSSPTNLPPHHKVLLPALSPTMTTGSIVSWEVGPGDKIEEGDAIATIETDKASMALEIQDEGYLAKILVEEGAKDLPLGTLLCIVVSEKEDVAAFSNYVESGDDSLQATAPAAAEQPAKIEKDIPGVLPPAPSPPASSAQSAAAASPTGRVIASPYAKKLAFDRGIDLVRLSGAGSGPGGRIRARDVEKAAASPPAPVRAAAPSAAQPAATQPAAPQPPAARPSAPTTPAANYTDVDLSNIRKVTAKRLMESKQTIPHYYLTIDVEMDRVMKIRKQFNDDLKSSGTKISVNDFVIKAAALACLKVPEANSSWRDTFIRKFNTVDMSVAVSTDTGLITPIVVDAHSKGLVAIAADVVALAQKAREGKLRPEEFMGGTFTISNLGMFGVKHFSAIINPPQACILAVGGARRELMPAADVDSESGSTRTATVMSVTLSCDHRVVDGAVGAQWLQHFKQLLENPLRMLL